MDSNIEINKTHLIVLKKKEQNKIYSDFKKLEFPNDIKYSISVIIKACENPKLSLKDIINQFKRKDLRSLNSLAGYYQYCDDYTVTSGKLIGWKLEKLISCLERQDLKNWPTRAREPWDEQHVFFRIKKDIIKLKLNEKIEKLETDITKINEKIEFYKNKNEKDYLNNIKSHQELVTRKEDKVSDLKNQRKDEEDFLIRWINIIYSRLEKASSLAKGYKDCDDDENILAYSHRKRGGAGREVNLTENFTYWFQTNFGFGNASYFYLVFKYKGISITPFSEWINYDFKKVSEIKRYSKSLTGKKPSSTRRIGNREYTNFKPVIDENSWLDAMNHLIEAYNCIQQNEQAFVDKYIIQECEVMVSGIEKLIYQEYVHPIGWNNKPHEIDLNGHYLMDYKLEKISGALEFINKILEFDGIMDSYDYIRRIEKMNKKIEPIIESELVDINSLLGKLPEDLNEKDRELSELKPILDKCFEKVEKLKIDLEDLNIKYRKAELEIITKNEDKNQILKSLKHINEKLKKTEDKYDETFEPLFDKIEKIREDKKNSEERLKTITESIKKSQLSFEKMKQNIDFDKYDVVKVDKKIKKLEKNLSESQEVYKKIFDENNILENERKKIDDEIQNLSIVKDNMNEYGKNIKEYFELKSEYFNS